MNNLEKLSQEIEEKVNLRERGLGDRAKFRDPLGKTSRIARSQNRQNARKNNISSDKDVIRHDLIHFRNLLIEIDSNSHEKSRAYFEEMIGWIMSFFGGKRNILNDKEIEIHVARAHGAGGQLTNKRETSVEMVHKISRITASCEDTPNRRENEKRALVHLKIKLDAHLSHWRELKRLNPEMGRIEDLRHTLREILALPKDI